MASFKHKFKTFVQKLSLKRNVITLDNAEELIQLANSMYYFTPNFDKYSPQEYSILDSQARPWVFNGPVEINNQIYMYVLSNTQYDFSGELMLYFPQRLEICNPQDSQFLYGTSLRVKLK
jgi:hypothetical protein